MVVVIGQRFTQLVPGELVVGDDAAHDTGLFEHDQVAIQLALGEIGALITDFGHGQRPLARCEELDDRRPLLGQSQTAPGEMRCRCSTPISGRRGGHAPESTMVGLGAGPV